MNTADNEFRMEVDQRLKSLSSFFKSVETDYNSVEALRESYGLLEKTLSNDDLQVLFSQVAAIPHHQTLEEKLAVFVRVAPSVISLCQQKGFVDTDRILSLLWEIWLPLAFYWVSLHQQLQRPFIQGILGGQGTGKTTLGAIITLILDHLGYSCLSISLDDLYKTYSERQKLKLADPRLIWRGPPGTHDIDLGIEVLDRLREANRNTPVLVPRFDKSLEGGEGDRTTPETIHQVDIVLFEGWFVGVHPVDEKVFDHPPSPINTPADRLFALDINQKLRDYLPLWQRIDRLMVLYPQDYRFSKQWRQEAEAKMKASGKAGMTPEKIEAFVDYFWRSLHPELFITPLLTNPNLVDLVIEINRDHTPAAIYQPS